MNARLGWEKVIGWLIPVGAALASGIIAPYWIGIPRVGNLSLWPGLRLLALLYPAIFTFFLIGPAIHFFSSGKLPLRSLSLAIWAVSSLYLLSICFYALTLYSLWNKNPVGKFLLPPRSNYFFSIVFEYSRPYLVFLATGLVAAAIFLVLFLITRSRAVASAEIFLAAFLGLTLGPRRTLLVILTSSALAVIWFLFTLFRHRPLKFLRLTPFIFLVSYLAYLHLLPFL